jgi:hypothetical protein
VRFQETQMLPLRQTGSNKEHVAEALIQPKFQLHSHLEIAVWQLK